MSASEVSVEGDILVVVVTPDQPVVEVATSGLQGPPGPSGPSGPQGDPFVPSFYEASTPPLGPSRGDQWIVTTAIGGN